VFFFIDHQCRALDCCIRHWLSMYLWSFLHV